MSKGFELPKYGVLDSVRRPARKTNDLINSVAANFGDSVTWNDRIGANFIDRKGKAPIYFKLHGNKYANWVEFSCRDIEVLREIKQGFPNDFPYEVQVKEGLC